MSHWDLWGSNWIIGSMIMANWYLLFGASSDNIQRSMIGCRDFDWVWTLLAWLFMATHMFLHISILAEQLATDAAFVAEISHFMNAFVAFQIWFLIEWSIAGVALEKFVRRVSCIVNLEDVLARKHFAAYFATEFSLLQVYCVYMFVECTFSCEPRRAEFAFEFGSFRIFAPKR